MRLRLTILAVATLVLSARGADLTWTGGAADANWTSAGNWGGTAPVAFDSLFFAGSTRLNNNNNTPAGGSFFNGITFNSGGGSFTLNGNSVGLSGGITNNSAASQTINLNITLRNADRTVSTASGDITINGNIGQSGTRGLTKAGAGTLTLSGNNSYTGGTILSSGTLKLGASNVMPNTGTLTFAGGIFDPNNQTDTLGLLSLSANSTLNLHADGNLSSLTFSSALWGGTGSLIINDWSGSQQVAGDDDRIFITAAPSSDFLNHVHFDIGGVLYPGVMSGNELVPSLTPVPEPTEWAMIIFATLGVLYKFVLPRFRKTSLA